MNELVAASLFDSNLLVVTQVFIRGCVRRRSVHWSVGQSLSPLGRWSVSRSVTRFFFFAEIDLTSSNRTTMRLQVRSLACSFVYLVLY